MDNKRAELIETVRNFWNDWDQEVMKNCADSMTEKIMKWILNKGEIIDY